MNVFTIRSLNSERDGSPDTIVEVAGEVWQRSFGTGREQLRPHTLYFVWNAADDHRRNHLIGDNRTLLEIISAAFNPGIPEDDILPAISGFRPPYMGWNGDRFFWYGPQTHKGFEIAQLVDRCKQRQDKQLVGAGGA